jgi:hypothetical protein
MKFDISIMIFLNLNFKKWFDLKVEIWIANYYFGFSKILIESKNELSYFEYCYLNLKFDFSILKFVI